MVEIRGHVAWGRCGVLCGIHVGDVGCCGSRGRVDEVVGEGGAEGTEQNPGRCLLTVECAD